MIIPGIIVLPVQSMTFAFTGTFVFAELPIAVMMPFIMTNVWSGWTSCRCHPLFLHGSMQAYLPEQRCIFLPLN